MVGMRYILGTIDGTPHEVDGATFIKMKHWLNPTDESSSPATGAESRWFALEAGGGILVIAGAVAYLAEAPEGQQDRLSQFAILQRLLGLKPSDEHMRES